jgi:hypothetical protein
MEFLLLSVSGIPKRVESTRPRCNFTLVGEEHKATKPKYTNCNNGPEKELAELLRRDVCSYELSESNNLKQAKDT